MCRFSADINYVLPVLLTWLCVSVRCKSEGPACSCTSWVCSIPPNMRERSDQGMLVKKTKTKQRKGLFVAAAGWERIRSPKVGSAIVTRTAVVITIERDAVASSRLCSARQTAAGEQLEWNRERESAPSLCLSPARFISMTGRVIHFKQAGEGNLLSNR